MDYDGTDPIPTATWPANADGYDDYDGYLRSDDHDYGSTIHYNVINERCVGKCLILLINLYFCFQ